VRRLGGGLKNLASGDLTVRLGEGFSSTYAQIRDDFNEAIEKLKTTILTVVEGADAIETGAKEISSASDDLARRTEQQAASLEQTAATLTEITEAVKKSPKHQPCAAGGDQRRRGRQAERRRGASGGRCDERDRQVLAADQPDHRRGSTRSPSRPICSPSMLASRRRAPATRVADSRSSPRKFGRSRNARRKPQRRSRR